MTGIIVELVPGTRAGVIRALDGSRVPFAASVVLGDYDTLAVGHRVSYDLDRAGTRTAARVLREPVSSGSLKRSTTTLDLRYRGFDQVQSTRSYRFDSIAAGDTVRRFIVTVDLLLLARYHIGVQEAPALCMRKLAADLKESPQPETHELGNDDLRAHASARDAQAQRKKARPPVSGRRGSPPPMPWKR